MSTTEPGRPEASWRQIWRDLGYMLPGLPIAVASFVVAIAGLALGVGLFVVAFAGLAIMVGTLAAARGFAHTERRRVGWVERREVRPFHYRQVNGNLLGRLLGRLRDQQSWRDWTFAVLILPVRVLTWSLTIVWLALSIALTPLTLLAWAVSGGGGFRGLPRVFAYVLRGLVTLESMLVWGMLTDENAELRARAEALTHSRASAVQAEADTLRRVERDIHDGPQQRLVRLTMDLESAQRRFDNHDHNTALPLLEGAVNQTKEALAELRAVSRGIAPPILTDRGLPAALAAATARNPIPTTLDTTLHDNERLPSSIENAAYFVVTEALTNAAKHADATQCTVTVHRLDNTLHVQITDNGRGGAHPGKGHGLTGLNDRLTGIDATLDITSPPGNGTTITAQLPIPTQ
ncbi:signal transduction histidine kinase [Haloactinopolyspora alba]|uniref:histidine kinase n=2 Tax=Haloactinopolyspora alba TaxID=648780 RepID=A0A2P8E9F5_9ACTN|nr:sensor histidine kinase [Haloactinopolyspora alba]PSL06078.1 signal transduction histidine kinase [Haloactinopolyspora alba]